MLNRKMSAGTAAQKRSKCSILAGRPLLLAILLLSAVFCQAQYSDTALTSTHGIQFTTGTSRADSSFFIKDSTWYEKHIDTIKTDFVIIVDSNNFVKKVRCDFIIHKYEREQHSGYRLWVDRNRNDTFLLNGNPVEVLLYRPKGEQMLVGNSR